MGGDTVAIGRLGAPKGVRGDLKVHSYSGESAHFRKLKEVELRPAQSAGLAATARPGVLRLKVARVQGEGPSLTIAFEGYPSPEQARALTGYDIVVPMAMAAPLGPNEWYIDDLVGLSLVSEGRTMGTVKAVADGANEPWLEVALPDGRKAIVPFRKEFVGKVDIEGGSIELLAPYLLEA